MYACDVTCMHPPTHLHQHLVCVMAGPQRACVSTLPSPPPPAPRSAGQLSSCHGAMSPSSCPTPHHCPHCHCCPHPWRAPPHWTTHCRQAGRQGGREGRREGGREAGREGEREGGRGREGGREGGAERQEGMGREDKREDKREGQSDRKGKLEIRKETERKGKSLMHTSTPEICPPPPSLPVMKDIAIGYVSLSNQIS